MGAIPYWYVQIHAVEDFDESQEGGHDQTATPVVENVRDLAVLPDPPVALVHLPVLVRVQLEDHDLAAICSPRMLSA